MYLAYFLMHHQLVARVLSPSKALLRTRIEDDLVILSATYLYIYIIIHVYVYIYIHTYILLHPFQVGL